MIIPTLLYMVGAFLICYLIYGQIVRFWRTGEDALESYKLPPIAFSISRKKSCCGLEAFQKLVREKMLNDAIVKSVSPLGKSMFIIEIDIRDFNKFESEYGNMINIVRHFINLRTPHRLLSKAS